MGTFSSRSAVALAAGGCLVLLTAGRAGAGSPESPSSSTTSTTMTATSTPGTAVDAQPRFELRASSLKPPETMLGDTSTAMVDVVNVGSAPIVVDEVDVSGDGFQLRVDGCSDIEVTDSCRLEIGFTPSGTGESVGTVAVRVGDALETTSLLGDAVDTSPSTEPSAGSIELPETNDSPPSTDPPIKTPTTTTAPGIDAPHESELERCEREAEDVDVRFAPHDDMVVGDLAEVVVVASTDELDGATEASAGPSTTIVEVSLHCEVRAVLRGADFSIDPPGAQEASFLDSTTIEWIWQVRPLVAGTLTLRLELLPIVHEDGRILPGSPRRFETTIAVDAVEESLPDRASNFFSAVVDYPLVKGFGSLAAIGALLAAGWRWVLRKPWPWATRSVEAPPSPDTGS